MGRTRLSWNRLGAGRTVMPMSSAKELLEARDAARTGRGRRLREACGLSQCEVARLVGVRPSTINRWEADQRVPHGEVAERWALVLRDLAACVANDSRPSDSADRWQ
jgi:DNA-binding XRE family transcriptional regulator